MFELHKYGGPKIRSISVACTAALTRTALKTVTEWPDWVRQMQVAFNEFSAIKHLRRPGQTTLSQATLSQLLGLLTNCYQLEKCIRWFPQLQKME